MAAPLVIVGCLSKFHNGTSSTGLQRYVLMVWLVLGQLLGPILAEWQKERGSTEMDWATYSADREALITDELLRRLDINADQESRRKFDAVVSRLELRKFAAMKPVVFLSRAFPEFQALSLYMYFAIAYNICSIWGFVIVGQMLLDYGDCIRIY